eukprot:1351233-Rhodomonas_salina.1
MPRSMWDASISGTVDGVVTDLTTTTSVAPPPESAQLLVPAHRLDPAYPAARFAIAFMVVPC